MERIIVGYDGSEVGRSAFAHALMIAESAGASVLVVSVVEAPPAAATEIPVPWDPEVDVAEAEASLDELMRYGKAQHLDVNSEVHVGRLIEVIERLERPTDLVCVGFHGRFARAGLGSSTRALVDGGTCPLMIVHKELHAPNRVIGVYDGSPVSERAVQWARGLAGQTAWPLTLLAVTKPGLSMDETLQQAQDLAPEGQIVHFGPEDQSEAKQIEETAQQSSHGILVMGAFPENPVHNLFFGGTTAHVLKHVESPVILVR